MTAFARTAARTAVALAALWSTAALAGPFPFFEQPTLREAPPAVEEPTNSAELPASLRRQVVAYATSEAPGTIVIDTPHTYLYLVLGGGKAMRYGIGVGREGFTWSGTQTISRKQEWPDWIPPAEMIHRQPYLPRFMAGGPGNPLGARAMYLGNTVYRIHGTNAPSTIGHQVSSGCIRMLNEDVTDLYARANVGTKVVVLPMGSRHLPTARTRAAPSASVVPASEPAAPATRTFVTSNSARAFGLYCARARRCLRIKRGYVYEPFAAERRSRDPRQDRRGGFTRRAHRRHRGYQCPRQRAGQHDRRRQGKRHGGQGRRACRLFEPRGSRHPVTGTWKHRKRYSTKDEQP